MKIFTHCGNLNLILYIMLLRLEGAYHSKLVYWGNIGIMEKKMESIMMGSYIILEGRNDFCALHQLGLKL